MMTTHRTSHSSPLNRLIANLSLLVTRARAALIRIGLFDGYRPERHYMRGAGPKARAVEQSSKQA